MMLRAAAGSEGGTPAEQRLQLPVCFGSSRASGGTARIRPSPPEG
jgi:hypothetical protein